MSLLGWVATVGVGCIYVVLWRAAFATWFDDFGDEDWHWGYLVGGLVVTFLTAVLAGPFRLLGNMDGSRSALKVGALIAGADVQPEQLNARIRELERENARLERELGLGT